MFGPKDLALKRARIVNFALNRLRVGCGSAVNFGTDS